MKTYIISIVTLLASLALPISAQTESIDTKAAPDVPALPMRISGALTGEKHGTVAIFTKAGKGAFTALGTDSLAYGAQSPSTNSDSVKLAITPDANYIIRAGYPKVYKTGSDTTSVTLTAKADEGSAKVQAFVMPTYPVTVQLAYATPIIKVADVTLKKIVTTSDEVLPLLPAYIQVTLANGKKDSLKVAATNGWSFKASGSTGDGTAIYDAKVGAVNRFIATLVANAVPDSIDNGTVLTSTGTTCTAIVLVANTAEPLKPSEPNKGLIVSNGTGDNLNGELGGEKLPFNGTIEEAEVKNFEVDGTVKDATITLKGVTVSGNGKPEEAKTEIKEGANLTLRLEGTNTLGTLTVGSGASLVLDKGEGAKLEATTVSNSGTFRDSTATITTVTGSGKLSIDGSLTGGGSVNLNTKVALTASCTDKAGITSFIWQKRNADGSYTEVQKKDYNADGTLIETKSGEAFEGINDIYEPATASNGSTEYRCLIERKVTTTDDKGVEKTAVTLLSTQPAKVEVKSGSGPVIPPTNYTVTLPALEGFTSNPAPGQHSVEEGYSFSFSLTPSEGNTASAPVVTTSRGETIKPRQSDGKYVITGIYENITISFTSLPTANEAMETESIRIQSVAGAVYIQTAQPATTVIYTLSGQLVKMLNLSAGDSRIELSKGIYIIRIGSLHQKVIVR